MVKEILTKTVMTIMQSVQILTDMESKTIPRGRLRLGAWMAARGIEPKELADAVDTTEASISRWISGVRNPRKKQLIALEDFFEIEPGGLFRDPDEGSDRSLLAGLNKEKRQEVLNYIAFVRSRK
jgi:transcriptional regulator with XRE-family HTH domain